MDVLFVEKDSLLEKYNTIWDKVSADVKKEFDSKPFYSKIFLKTKIKCYSDEDTDFCNKKILKASSNHTCLTVITISLALKKEENYYLQVFLKEFKHIRKEVIKDIIGDPEISSDEYDKSDKEKINCLGYFLKRQV